MLSKIKQLFTIETDLSSRVYGFDIMRGVGILIVLYAHGRSKMPFFPAFNDFISVIGFWLMDLFFVLSGFLIGMILIKFYEKEQTFNWKTAYNFWIRRWFRTLPNYYLVLFITAILWAIDGKMMFFKLKFLAYMLFSHTVALPPNYFLMESWTLCIEEWFYLLFPLLLLAGHQWIKRSDSKQGIKYNILAAIILFFAVPMALRIGVYAAQPPLAWIDMSRMTFFRLDTIAVGILMAWINFYYKDILKQYRRTAGWLFLLLMAVYLAFFYIVLLPDLQRQTSFFSFTFFYLLSGLASLCLTVYMKEVKLEKPTFFARFITVISLISYSLYIFHRSVVMHLVDKFFNPAPVSVIENVALFTLYVIASILLSIVVYKYYEHPMTELREKLKK